MPIKIDLRAKGAGAATVAGVLAEAKARKISKDHSTAFVLGADQILVCDDVLFDKPADMAAAEGHLRALRGKTHRLISAICLVHEGQVVWRYQAEARLTMRWFGDEFLKHYLAMAGPGILESVGAYRLEGIGSQLFSSIEGDYFTVLGLPLLPLLARLRKAGVLAE